MSPPSESTTPQRRPRVLLVDDDPDIAQILGLVLRRDGFEVRTAHDADQAWRELSPDIDLVLLDIMLPGENGPEVLRRMQLDPMLTDIPVVFVTARSDPAIRMQCIAMGATGFLTKPFRSAQVLEIVRAAVARSRAGSPVDGRAGACADGPLESELRTALALGGDSAVGAGGGQGPPAASSSDGGPAGEVPISDLVQTLLSERQRTRGAFASQHRLISALFRLHRMSLARLGPERMAEGIVEMATDLLAARRVTLRIHAGRELSVLACAPSHDAAPVRLDGVSLAARAWGDMLVTEGESPEGDHELHVPLTAGGDRLGLLSLVVDPSLRPSATLATFFAAEAALVLDGAMRISRAETQALLDPLTGVHNRRFLDQRLAEEVRVAEQRGRELSVLFVDVDRFKALNDGYGHAEGDRILRAVAEAMRSGLRERDLIARYGGEEFVVMLPGTGPEGACNAAERVRAAVEGHGLRASGAPPEDRVTVTIGVASFPLDADSATSLVEHADIAMLRGKHNGRNRVESHQLEIAASSLAGGGGWAVSGAELAGARPAGPGRRSSRELAASARLATEVTRAMVASLRVKDPYSGRHSLAVGALSARLATRMSPDPEFVRTTALAGLLHDIGKLHTPDAILRKPGPLTLEEAVIMRRHADVGADLVAASPPVRHLAPIVRWSQEHFDGKGYPDGLGGEAIPLGARIIAVADAYHAMCSDRPYRSAAPREVAIAELRRCSGTQFDPQVVETLVGMLTADIAATTPRRRDLANAA